MGTDSNCKEFYNLKMRAHRGERSLWMFPYIDKEAVFHEIFLITWDNGARGGFNVWGMLTSLEYA